MTRTEIMWLGLRTDREKEIFVEGFWYGVGDGKAMEGQVSACETNWRNEQNPTAAVQRNLDKVYDGRGLY